MGANPVLQAIALEDGDGPVDAEALALADAEADAEADALALEEGMSVAGSGSAIWSAVALARMSTELPRSTRRIGIRKSNGIVMLTRLRVPGCGSDAHPTAVPAVFSQATVTFAKLTVTAELRFSKLIAQPIRFEVAAGLVHGPEYESGARAATSTPARAAFSAVTCA
jgi:hypothetical protein